MRANVSKINSHPYESPVIVIKEILSTQKYTEALNREEDLPKGHK